MRRASLPTTVGGGLLLAGAVLADVAPVPADAFSGRYRLTLTFASSCQATVHSVSVAFDLAESTSGSDSEVSGELTAPYEANLGRLILLHRNANLHGPFSTVLGQSDRREPVTTIEGYYLTPWLMLDGTTTSSSDRPRASGTAMGVLQLGEAEDEVPDSLGYCTARDHQWSLEPE